MEVKTQTETTAVPFSEQCNSYHLMATVRAPELQHDQDNVQPVSLVVLGDISGSMHGAKMNQMKLTMKKIVQFLPPNAQLSIILYDNNVETVRPLGPVTAEQKDHLYHKIDAIHSHGMTDIGKALFEGRNEIAKAPADSLKAILLLTDGRPTCGINNAADMIGELGPVDYRIHCFGIGNDHLPDLLQTVATHGAGNYNYIETADQATTAFGQCVGGLMSTYAEDIQMRIKIADLEVVRVKAGYPVVQEGGYHVIKIPDIQEGETRDILVEVKLPKENNAQEEKVVGEVDVTAKLRESGEQFGSNQLFKVSRPPYGFPCVPDPGVSQNINRFVMTDALDRAKELAKDDDFAEARAELDRAIEKIEKSPTAGLPMCQQLISDLKACKEGYKDKVTYHKRGGYLSTAVSSNYVSQRSNTTGTGGAEYLTATQTQYVNLYTGKSSDGSMHVEI